QARLRRRRVPALGPPSRAGASPGTGVQRPNCAGPSRVASSFDVGTRSLDARAPRLRGKADTHGFAQLDSPSGSQGCRSRALGAVARDVRAAHGEGASGRRAEALHDDVLPERDRRLLAVADDWLGVDALADPRAGHAREAIRARAQQRVNTGPFGATNNGNPEPSHSNLGAS